LRSDANAEDPRVALSSTVPVLRQAVLPCSKALLGLAERLEQPRTRSTRAASLERCSY
jgi:hypothetical protein